MAYRFLKSIEAKLRQLANNDVWEICDTGAPSNGTSGTGAGYSGPGSTYVNLTTGAMYINTNTKASPTWSLLATGSFNPTAGIVASGTASSGTTTGTSISAVGVLATDIVLATWKVASQTIAHIIASATTDAITVTLSTTVGTAGTIQYSVIRGQ